MFTERNFNVTGLITGKLTHSDVCRAQGPRVGVTGLWWSTGSV